MGKEPVFLLLADSSEKEALLQRANGFAKVLGSEVKGTNGPVQDWGVVALERGSRLQQLFQPKHL